MSGYGNDRYGGGYPSGEHQNMPQIMEDERFYGSGQLNPNDPRLRDPKNQPYRGTPNSPRTPISGMPKELTFDIEYKSEVDECHYRGSFTVRKPKLRDRTAIMSKKSDYLGGKYHDPENPGYGVPQWMDLTAEAMAFLDVLLIHYPNWWTGSEDVEDTELIWRIFEKAVEIDPFQRPERRNDDAGSESPNREAGNRKPNESRSRGDIEDLVDEQL